MKLSVLDQSPIAQGRTRAEALKQTISVAQAVSGLGYSRFWLAEHHDSPGFAGTSPEIMAMAVLDATEGIRVGSGGVLLARHNPGRVAETFAVLAALHPGRVDLGVGRAGPGSPTDFNSKLLDLHDGLGLTTGEPDPVDVQMWILGAGSSSAPVAGAFGAGYAHAHFLNSDSGESAVDSYLKSFHPSTYRQAPEPVAAVRVIVAESGDEAQRLADSVRLWRARKDLGRDEPFPTYQESEPRHWTNQESGRRSPNDRRIIVGDAPSVAAELRVLAKSLHVEELLINTPLPYIDGRLRSFALLSEQLLQDEVALPFHATL